MRKLMWIPAVILMLAVGVSADQMTFNTSDDSWVNGNTSQVGDNYGAISGIRIRHQNESWGNNYGLAKFDLTSLTSTLEPDQSILVTSARMRFYTSYTSWPGPTNFSPVAIFQNLEDWDELTVVFSNAPVIASASVQSLEYFGIPANPVYFTGTNTVDAAAWLEYTDVNVAQLVQGWLNGTIDNYGVSLKATEIVDSARIFSPQTKEHVNPAIRPALIINYTIIDGAAYAKVEASDDSWVNGNNSQQGANYGTSTAMRIRHDNDTWGNNYSMAKFDLSSITGALQPGDTVQVNSAQMRFYVDLLTWPASPTNFSPIAIYDNTTAWDETTVAWSNAPVIDPVAVVTLDHFGESASAVGFTGSEVISSGGWLEYTGAEVASLVEGWLNGDNYGVSIKASEIVDSSRLFTPLSKEYGDAWLRPEVIINYTVIPDAAGSDSSQIVSVDMVSGNVLKLLVDTDSFLLSKQTVVCRNSLTTGEWVQVGHSDQAAGPFIETNLTHSAADGDNYAVFVESTNSAAFFGIQ